ncbi:MAG: ABC transporter ATP-binding protein [Phycisphaerales bacterium]|nr:ABC transporter ATP-binding protein [Phycisphaerales bacterium]
MIECRDLAFSYGGGDFALRLERLDIEEGTRLACIGPSGCGKTTLVNLLTGILMPDAGHVRIDGQPLDTMSDQQRRAFRLERIGMVFQEFELLPYVNAIENILLPARLAGRVDADLRIRAENLALDLGLDAQRRRHPDRLSQGERQRVAIGRALVLVPRLIFCDEPTGNLDPKTAARILDLLFERAGDTTLFMVTHNHEILERFDRVLDMTDLHA